MGVEAASQPRRSPAQRIGELFRAAARDAEAAGRDLAVVDGEKRPADAAAGDVAHYDEEQHGRDEQDGEIGHEPDLEAGHAERPQARRGHPRESHHASRYVVPLAHDLEEDHAEAERHHGEVNVADPPGRK